MTAATTLTRTEAAAAAEQAQAERDRIQANLLELDQSLGQRILAGADRLTGLTAARWTQTQARQAWLWPAFLAYSAAVDRACDLLARHRRPGRPELAELSGLLTGPAVRLPRPAARLDQRDLLDPGQVELTLATAVAQMRAAYTEVAEVLAAAEAVWTALAGPLDQAAQALAGARAQLPGTEDALARQLASAEAERAELHEVLTTDPLSLWGPGRTGGSEPGVVDTARLDRLREQVADVAARAAEVTALRAGADTRLAAMAAAVEAASTAWQDTRLAREQTAAKIAGVALPPLPAPPALAGQLADLHELRAAGRWGPLADGLAAVAQLTADAQQHFYEVQISLRDLLGRRDELRGRLGAYRAKATALGAAEDIDLSARSRRAQDLLWTAPCDLEQASQAVRDYQDAVLTLGDDRPSGQPGGPASGQPGGPEAQP